MLGPLSFNSPWRIWITLVLICFFVAILEFERLDAQVADLAQDYDFWEEYIHLRQWIPKVQALDTFSKFQDWLVEIGQGSYFVGQKQSLASAEQETFSMQKIKVSRIYRRSLWSEAFNFKDSAEYGSLLLLSQSPLSTCSMLKDPRQTWFITEYNQDRIFLDAPWDEFLALLEPQQPLSMASAHQNENFKGPSQPIKVLLAGDSLMMEGFGPVLLRTLRQRKDFVVHREAKYSTGLSRPDYFNWPEHMAALVRNFNPELIILCLGANDAQDIIDEHKKRHVAGTKTWAVQYRRRAQALAEIAQQKGAKLIWVGLPIMGQEPHATRVKMLSREQYRVTLMAPQTRIYVNTYPVLTDADGQYASLLPNSNGTLVRMRYKDKIHVNEAGGEMLVDYVLPFIDLLFPPCKTFISQQAQAPHG